MSLSGTLLFATGFEDGLNGSMLIGATFPSDIAVIPVASLHGLFELDVNKAFDAIQAGVATAQYDFETSTSAGEQRWISQAGGISATIAINFISLVAFETDAFMGFGPNANNLWLWINPSRHLMIGSQTALGGGDNGYYCDVRVHSDGDASGNGATLLHQSKTYSFYQDTTGLDTLNCVGTGTILDTGFIFNLLTTYRVELRMWPMSRLGTVYAPTAITVGLLNQTNSALHWRLDDVVVVAGGRPAPPAPIVKEYRTPTGTGDFDTWDDVPAAGNKWEKIDDRPPLATAGTDIITKPAAVLTAQTFTTSAHAVNGNVPAGANILGTNTYGRKDNPFGAWGRMTWVQRLGGTSVESIPNLPSSPVPAQPLVRSHDPTGADWTIANLNATQVGVSHTSSIGATDPINVDTVIQEVAIGADFSGDAYTRPKDTQVIGR